MQSISLLLSCRKTEIHPASIRFSIVENKTRKRATTRRKSLHMKEFKGRFPRIGSVYGSGRRFHAQTSDFRNIAAHFPALNVFNVLNNFGALKFRKFALLPVSIFRGSLANLMNWKSFRDGSRLTYVGSFCAYANMARFINTLFHVRRWGIVRSENVRIRMRGKIVEITFRKMAFLRSGEGPHGKIK